MSLPFSHDAFLDVFATYNAQVWPVVALIWIVTAGVAWRWLRGGVGGRLVFSLLAVHWLWSGVVYHWLFFRPINPAAAVFALLFVVQAAVFTWLGLRSHVQVQRPAGTRGFVAVAFVIYSLVYPLAGLAFGLQYPRMPVFAVPCPTTLLTVGFLVAAGAPRVAGVLPLVWAIVGCSAAFVLGIYGDLALGIAGLALMVDMLVPSVFGARMSQPPAAVAAARR